MVGGTVWSDRKKRMEWSVGDGGGWSVRRVGVEIGRKGAEGVVGSSGKEKGLWEQMECLEREIGEWEERNGGKAKWCERWGVASEEIWEG